MKKKFALIILILLFPLLTSFSMASFIKEAECNHCMALKKNTPECCVVGSPDVMHGSDSCSTTNDTTQCPHGGFCQEDDKAAVQISTNSVSETIAVYQLAIIPHNLARYYQTDQRNIRPPPLSSSNPIFVVNCSFLI